MPFPYVVTVLYHTNNDNSVTKTRKFSEFLILLCVVINNVFENKFCKCHKLVGVALRPPPVADKGSKALSEITSKRQYIYVQRIACNRVQCTRTRGHGSPLHYFGNCISFIQFIFIINFLPLLGGRIISAPTNKQQLSYKQKRSGNNVLRFANCLPDRNFPFSTFNFKKSQM